MSTIDTRPPNDEVAEQKDWTAVASESLARAYGDDEPEYSLNELHQVYRCGTGRLVQQSWDDRH